jgi:protein MpaA
VVLGHSVQGRGITATEVGDFDSLRKTLVVGCIHGNECAGIAVAGRLARAATPAESDIWIVPWHWRRLGGLYDSGRRPFSESETRLAYRLIARVRPSVTIWFHQHLDVVDDSTGSRAIERRFARTAGLRLASLTREPGSAVTWQSHCSPRAPAFVVELPAGTLAPAATTRLVRAVDGAAARAPAAPSGARACKAGR